MTLATDPQLARCLRLKSSPATYIAELEAEIVRLNHQHANDEAANRMLSDWIVLDHVFYI